MEINEDTSVSMAVSERADLLLPAPGRGQYDRALTRERRQAEQRERLLLATAAAYASGDEGVSGAVRLAGIGRNTFYEYFDDFTHALEAVRSRAQARVQTECALAVTKARTPVERLRTLSRAWCGSLLASADEAIVLLCSEARRPDQPLSLAGRVLAASFEQVRREGVRGAAQDPALVVAAAAAAEALVLKALSERSEAEVPSGLVLQIAIRLLR
jgi:AcrR family transcriptional regulator